MIPPRSDPRGAVEGRTFPAGLYDSLGALAAIVARRSKTGGATSAAPKFPRFLVGFAALVALNSLGAIPAPARARVNQFSTWCLATAVAALGMKTSIGDIVAVGWRPVALTLVETLWIAILVFGLTWLWL